jgi:hypothetical protein
LRPRLVVGAIATFFSVGLVLTFLLLGSNLFSTLASSENRFRYQEPPSQLVNPIARENTEPGTTNWRIPPGKESTVEIQAYADATSILPGHWLTFYVSTLKNKTPYLIDIYRLGWYNGYGGRLMAHVASQPGQRQGYYDPTTHLRPTAQSRLVGCESCYVDKNTGLVEAKWSPSYHLYIPTEWTTGVYLAKFTDIAGKQTYVPFDVLGNFHSLVLAVTPDTTYAAYNSWGGYSLYDADSAGVGAAPSETDTTVAASDSNGIVRAVKVSFDRPYVQEYGSSQVLIFEADAIRWMEHQGYDIAYTSDVDLQNNPAQLLTRRVYISLGHDEYWTKEMRDAVERARDSGVGLAFFGADTSYWQMRFAPDTYGVPDRTVVCYKVDSNLGVQDLMRDPLYGVDNSRVTSRWRDRVVGRPENSMIGVMYSGLTHSQLGFPWQLDTGSINSPLLNGTSLLPGTQYGCGLVGYEWDRVFNNGATPSGLQVIGTSKTENNFNQADLSNTTYYIAKSGAMVFASGSIYWATALDKYRVQVDANCFGYKGAIPAIQRLMTNVMAALVHRYQPGQKVSVNSLALSIPASPLFSSIQRLPQQIALNWERLFPISTALVFGGIYVVRKRQNYFARRRFL